MSIRLSSNILKREKVLFVNSGFTASIKGMHPAESKAILTMLFDYISKTHRLTCRVNWQPNTLTLWDNRCTQHHALWDYYPESRYGERVSILGNSRRLPWLSKLARG